MVVENDRATIGQQLTIPSLQPRATRVIRCQTHPWVVDHSNASERLRQCVQVPLVTAGPGSTPFLAGFDAALTPPAKCPEPIVVTTEGDHAAAVIAPGLTVGAAE